MMASALRKVGVSEKEANDRVKWKWRTMITDSLREKAKEKKKIVWNYKVMVLIEMYYFEQSYWHYFMKL